MANIIYFLVYSILPAFIAWKLFANSNKKVLWTVISFLFSFMGLLISWLLENFVFKSH